MFGDFHADDHDGDSGHDHDDIDPGPLEDNPIWRRDNVALASMGIDTGSAGTQVIFFALHLQGLRDRPTAAEARRSPGRPLRGSPGRWPGL